MPISKKAKQSGTSAGGGNQSRVWRWIRENVEPLKVIFAILAGLFALFEYKSKDYVDRVKNSSDVVDKYYASDEYKALLKVQDFQWSDAYVAKQTQLAQNNISSQQFRQFVAEGIKRNYSADFIKTVRGMKAVSICAIQGRCEPLSICMYLSQSMQDLRCDFREVIAELSTNNGSCVIDEINYILDNYCANWMASYMGIPKYSSIKDNYCLFDKEKNQSLIGEYCVKSIIYKRPSSFFDRILE
jgi:hypothetical protein